MRPWTFLKPTRKHARLLESWQARVERGFVVNGCLPKDDYSEMIEDELAASAVSVEYLTSYVAGEMPVVRYDADFERWLERRGGILDALRTERLQNILPWDVLKALPDERKKSDRLYFSQGSMPSCMGHADAFAEHSSTLSAVAQGLPLVYESFNPLVTWYLSKGKSTRGGQNVSAMAKASNGVGHFPESRVGTDNQRVPDYAPHSDVALNHQAGIVFLPGKGAELARTVTRCCRAGLGVACGNSTAVRGAEKDANGIKIAVLGGSWAHATSFTGYRRIDGEEYVFWVNSHGPRYGRSDEGEPADGAWMRTEKELARFCGTMDGYGAPYAVLPEAVAVADFSHGTPFKVPFPKNWKG